MWMLFACGLFDTTTTVTVVNDGNRAIGPVTVEADDEQVWHGMLAPGERRTVVYRPRRDTDFHVFGHGPAGSFDADGLGYTTPGDGQDHVFHIRQNVVRYGDATTHANRVRLLLDAPELRAFLHPEVPGNLPLTMAVPSSLDREARQTRFEGQPVTVTRSARLIVEEHGAGFRIRIPDEGVEGTVRFDEDDAGWTLGSLSLAEH